MDCCPPAVHGILQAQTLQWVAISFSLGIFQTQRSNPHLLGLLHWQAGSLPLAPPGKPKEFPHRHWMLPHKTFRRDTGEDRAWGCDYMELRSFKFRCLLFFFFGRGLRPPEARSVFPLPGYICHLAHCLKYSLAQSVFILTSELKPLAHSAALPWAAAMWQA